MSYPKRKFLSDKIVATFKTLAHWLFAIFKGFGMGVVCMFTFLFTAIGQFAKCLGIYAAYILRLAILTCILAPLHLLGMGFAHVICGEMPHIGINKPIWSVCLFLLSTLITAVMPPLQFLSLLIDLLILQPMGKITIYERTDYGLCIHRWLFEFLDDIGD